MSLGSRVPWRMTSIICIYPPQPDPLASPWTPFSPSSTLWLPSGTHIWFRDIFHGQTEAAITFLDDCILHHFEDNPSSFSPTNLSSNLPSPHIIISFSYILIVHIFLLLLAFRIKYVIRDFCNPPQVTVPSHLLLFPSVTRAFCPMRPVLEQSENTS